MPSHFFGEILEDATFSADQVGSGARQRLTKSPRVLEAANRWIGDTV